MSELKLMKISSVSFGFGGYNDAQLGYNFAISSVSIGVQDFWGFWSEWDSNCKWSKQDQIKYFGELSVRVSEVIKQAKVNDFSQLKGKPVEVTFDGNRLKSWRILTEVI